MDISGVIEVKKAIVHIVNQKEKHIMSDYEIELNDTFKSLIIGHINKTNISESKIFVKFNNEDDNAVRNSCLKIFENEDIFIEESKNISRELYQAMGGTNASAANLLLVYFTHGSKKAFAIIKLDFSNNYYTKYEKVEGKTKVKLEIEGTGFSESQKLRKCAIINEDTIGIKNEGEEVKEGEKVFLLLDTQSGDVSDYFRISFLDCELINDAKNNTKKIVKTINKYINNKFGENPKEMVNKTYLFTSVMENNTEFKTDTILKAIFTKKEEIDEIKKIINDENIDSTFTIDKNTSEKKFKNVTIVTDSGISLKAKSSLFNEEDIILSEPDKDGKVDITLKGIKIDKNKIG
ncbi:TPA: nucleoid-associated protein [Clostridium perfringens]|nr:nucleoid-associated protein [Clostridium perfringens]ELC8383010.1 nucleoid-associated protein [Clostridium perfringens]MDT7925263.1 nucleoid-associated protein [Clostridium perfringens]MDT7978203.1 nucleoid-associated protein [Clostridium perfringens]MDT8009681.1 nucleoid-associated protein [Clostridium perfringens]MDU6894719.1 nucleoid-associated protein [Clostridium perfringens]